MISSSFCILSFEAVARWSMWVSIRCDLSWILRMLFRSVISSSSFAKSLALVSSSSSGAPPDPLPFSFDIEIQLEAKFGYPNSYRAIAMASDIPRSVLPSLGFQCCRGHPRENANRETWMLMREVKNQHSAVASALKNDQDWKETRETKGQETPKRCLHKIGTHEESPSQETLVCECHYRHRDT